MKGREGVKEGDKICKFTEKGYNQGNNRKCCFHNCSFTQNPDSIFFINNVLLWLFPLTFLGEDTFITLGAKFTKRTNLCSSTAGEPVNLAVPEQPRDFYQLRYVPQAQRGSRRLQIRFFQSFLSTMGQLWLDRNTVSWPEVCKRDISPSGKYRLGRLFPVWMNPVVSFITRPPLHQVLAVRPDRFLSVGGSRLGNTWNRSEETEGLRLSHAGHVHAARTSSGVLAITSRRPPQVTHGHASTLVGSVDVLQLKNAKGVFSPFHVKYR